MRYEKGRKDASRQRIMEVAAERFRSDGIAASGLAGIATVPSTASSFRANSARAPGAYGSRPRCAES